MNASDKGFLDKMGIYINPSIINEYHKRGHRGHGAGTRFYYYRNRHKIFINPENISYDKEVSSTLHYKKNAFYKMSHLCNEDPFFDFYFTLKSDTPKSVIKRNERKGYAVRSPVPPRNGCFERKHGKFVVKFQ
jgi:hypothetical protein